MGPAKNEVDIKLSLASQKAHDYKELFQALYEPLQEHNYSNCGCRAKFVSLLEKVKPKVQKLEKKGPTLAAVDRLIRKVKTSEEGYTAKEREAEEWKKRYDGHQKELQELKREYEEKLEKQVNQFVDMKVDRDGFKKYADILVERVNEIEANKQWIEK
jgi:DNA repair exonuclease SbcCD ATPase subunit